MPHALTRFLARNRLCWLAVLALATSVASAAPARPAGMSPGSATAPGVVLASSSVTLQWNAATGATRYGLGVVDVATGAWVVNTDVTGRTSYVAALSPGKGYRWNINACNASGCSAYAALAYFQTAAPAKTLSSVAVSCAPSTVNEGAAAVCTASARYSDNSSENITRGATWAGSAGTVSVSGGFTAPAVAADTAVTVKASYRYNGGTAREGSATLTVKDVPAAAAFTLTVTKKGLGQGSVSGPGIDCGTLCSKAYPSGTTVTLTARAVTGWRFVGWGGGLCTGTGGCTVNLVPPRNTLTEVTAEFAADTASPALQVVLSPAASQALYQYTDQRFTFTWPAGGSVPAGAALTMDDAEIRASQVTGRSLTVVARPLLAGAGKRWRLSAGGGELASGVLTVANARPFAVMADTPAYAANPATPAMPGGRGYCRPQCAEFVQAQLGLVGARGYAKNFWPRPYEGYVNQTQGTSQRPPRPGDILVWGGALNADMAICRDDGGCGHVAIVKSVDLASGTLTRVDANWRGTCAVMETTTMTVTRNATTRAYSIGGTNSTHLLGWQSRD